MATLMLMAMVSSVDMGYSARDCIGLEMAIEITVVMEMAMAMR